jgi:iron complex outermembrane recepter protein
MARCLLYRLFFILTFLFIVNFCKAQTVQITGKVKGNEFVLASATVKLNNETLLTDEKGEFRVSLPVGTYVITITHAGFKKFEQDLIVSNNAGQHFEFILIPTELLEEVVMIGSRSLRQRTNLNAAVPITVYSSKLLTETGQNNLVQMLQFTVPSFNASRQLVSEPITLRGLDPDQVLILVNGNRYHNMAYLTQGIRGMLGNRGAVSNDLNSIPFSAIEKIEILSDGAAAQYGSDAIAGVINIILKKTTGVTLVSSHMGQFYKADGESYWLGLNHGISFKKKTPPAGRPGYLNVSADVRRRNPTYRGGTYTGTVYVNDPQQDNIIIESRNFDRKKVSNAGSSKHSGVGFILNAGHPLGGKEDLFWTASINDRKTVFIAPLTFPKNALRINTALYPDGFRARPNHNTTDVYALAGVRGETKNHWSWEYSSAIGKNHDRYCVDSSNNASQFFTLGAHAPTSFYTGTLVYQLQTNSFHTSKKIVSSNIRSVNIGWGSEWRVEKFRTKAGEEASWKNYDTGKQAGTLGLVFTPEDVVNETRNVIGAYLDVESEFAKRFLANFAGRYEYYSDFGSNLAGKLALRYKFSDLLSLRSSAGNGFRAPSLQQRHFNVTSVTHVNRGGLVFPVTRGIFRNNSHVAVAFGVPSLTAERSLNLSGGIVSRFSRHFYLTADLYWIQIKDRIILSGVFDTTNADVKEILKNITGIDQVQFFTNAINTRTLGTDIVLNGTWFTRNTSLHMILAANFTRNRLFGRIKTTTNLAANAQNTNTLFSRDGIVSLENGQPSSKIILTLNYKIGRLSFLLRNTRFGKTSVVFSAANENRDEFFSSKILTDCSTSYKPAAWVTITIGANNISDIYPDRIKNSLNTGEGIYIYSQEATPFGFNGGYYFVNMSFNW